MLIFKGLQTLALSVSFRRFPSSPDSDSNSKCDRAFVAPPEFKSLMLRQSTVQCAFFERSVPLFMQKAEFLSLTIS